MSPALLLPAALAALATLLIPVVIHIARRTESRTIDFAALRWLDQRPKPRRRMRIDERWLLLVRLVLLALIAIWLAKPVLGGVASDRPVVAIAPGVDPAKIDMADDDRVVWLAPDFPVVSDGEPPSSGALSSLIRQLDAELPPETPVTMIVPAILDGADAERPRLSRRVEWRVMPGNALRQSATRATPPALTVRYSGESENGVRYFRAAATAWAEADGPIAFETALVDRPLHAQARYLIWLSASPLPDPVMAWIRQGGTVLLSRDASLPVDSQANAVWRDALGDPLVMANPLGEGRVLRLTRSLEPEAMPQLIEADFPDHLARILVPPPLPGRVRAADHFPLTGGVAYDQPPYDVRPWLALIIALIFGIERWLATHSKRAVAP